MIGSKWIIRCRVAGGLWLLASLGIGNAYAAGWQDEPQARAQLHQLGLELALADVHPELTLWWQQAVAPDTASDAADDRLLLGLQSFWRHWSSLSFNDRQYLRSAKAKLSFSEIDEINLRLANEVGTRAELVSRLAPGYGDHQQLSQQLDRLLTLNQQPWPTLRGVTVRPNERHAHIVDIRERLQLLGDMPSPEPSALPLPSQLDMALLDVAAEDELDQHLDQALDHGLNNNGLPEGVSLASSVDDVAQDEPAGSDLDQAELSELGYSEADLVAAGMIEDAATGEPLTQTKPGSVMAALSGSQSGSVAASTFVDLEYYDAELETAVKRFQARHGLTVDGVIGPQTYAWLDVTPVKRAQFLMRSLMRTLISDDLPTSYLLVNIPEYHLRLYQDQVLVFESNVIVGQNQRKTPIMSSKITSVVFNPPWNVPRSILNKDIVPKLHRDPGYLDRQGFEVLDNSGTVHIPREEWQTRLEEGGGFPYRLRQRPGRGNALGAYKFHLPNNDAIYLHDTPGRSLFARDSRAFSSGCVRVEGAEQLADWLVAGQLSKGRLAALKANKETRWVKVNQPLPLFMVYWSGWLSGDALPHFRNDIYGFDKQVQSPFKAAG